MLKVPSSRQGAALVETYIADRTDPAELEKLELLLIVQKLSRSRGTGRPTKKERREIERFDTQESEALPAESSEV